MCKALKVTTKSDDRKSYYRCSDCNAMFRPMIFFEDYTYFDCIPRVCPNCAKFFKNGMEFVG